MVKFMMFSLIFFLMGFLMFLMGLMFYYYDYIIIIEWEIFNFNSMMMNMLLYFDWMSLMFVGVVMLIFSSVMMYSIEYMMMELNLNRFIYLVLMFIYSMFLMILSPNILSILIGWDGLGLISYCLIIFYQNINSYNSGMLTILCNRLGDISLILSMFYMLIFGSWNLILYNNLNYFCMILLIICSITKSAQFPFSIWLPAAMAAPTPISSLVHSSTLVTAGIYLMIRLMYFLNMLELNFYLLMISSFTMFMSGIVANFEFDLKKIIALSTLSQLGLMMSILSLGYSDLSFFHLLVHAMFKSLLFLCSGVIIHLMMDNQDIRFYGGIFNKLPFMSSCMLISICSLCGFPFFSGFYSKDLIMEIMFMNYMNLFSLLLLIFSTILTVSYNFRLILYLYFNIYNLNCYMNFMENKYMSFSMIFLVLMSMFYGKLMIYTFFYSYEIILSLFMKMLVLMLCFMGLFMGFYLYNFFMKSKLLMFFNSMYFMKFFYMNFNLINEFSSNFNLIFEKNFLENKFSLMFLKMNFMFMFYNYNKIVLTDMLKLIIVMFFIMIIFF
uniref:NADH:ubiquinone reductase (H(+)-translocating) n=1 Tax=Cerceris quinquefasciata TaxID=2026451 RepID=A0A8B0JX95_9HYME|nr:NADH dehydrogenase subunit 5 [Cerceris quinquefasciata]QTV22618.1 NADH dehydrogenase subunit 5 [Cerceris quinquefasciata]